MSDRDDDRDEEWREFKSAVNMTATELEHWLESDESQEVGQKSGDEESTGHASGRRIVEILRAKKSDLSDDDYDHMRKVVGYVHRHLAQRPDHPEHSRWRYSLMNWGHDPQK